MRGIFIQKLECGATKSYHTKVEININLKKYMYKKYGPKDYQKSDTNCHDIDVYTIKDLCIFLLYIYPKLCTVKIMMKQNIV